jgi:hypothetical protein
MSVEDITTEAEASDDTPVATEAEQPSDAPDDGDDSEFGDLESVWDKVNQPRGSDGKFASRNGAEDGDSEQADDESDAGQPEDEDADTAVETPPVAVPESWPADVKERFQALPPEFRDVQEFVAQRDREQGDAIDRIGHEIHAVEERLMQSEPLENVVQAYQDEFVRRGIHPAQAFHSLLNAQRMLDSNPLGGIVQLGRSYGFDLLPILQQAGVQVQPLQQAQQFDPNVAALQSELQQIKSKMTAQEQAELEAQNQRLDAAIAEFAKDKPYFDEVRPDMAVLLRGGAAKDIAEAYDKAIHANPSTRARVQQAARQADEAKRAAEQKAKADKARKSTAVNVKSAPASRSNTQKTIDDTLNDVASRHYG